MASMHGLLFVILLIAVLMQFQIVIVIAEPPVPCFFIFGDSLVDNGNNNRLVTTQKSNYPPYGIDFPQGATGRFTNGRTLVDFIVELQDGPEFIPPFANLSLSNNKISLGVNYGSGGAGIRPETGINQGDRISLDRQLLNHATVLSQLLLQQGNLTFTNEYKKKCIYMVNIGSSDYINNYLMPENYLTSRIYTPDQYAAILIQELSNQLSTLYTMGARKVAVFGLGPIGCTPAEIARVGTNGRPCVESINNITMLFNNRLKPLVDDLNNRLPDARFTFINATNIAIADPRLALQNAPCCQVQSNGLCIPNSIPCRNRAATAWFDGYHPSEVSNRRFAARAYTARSPLDASPYDISTLARL